MAATGVVFWGAVVGAVGSELLGRALDQHWRRRRRRRGDGDDDGDGETSSRAAASSTGGGGSEEQEEEVVMVEKEDEASSTSQPPPGAKEKPRSWPRRLARTACRGALACAVAAAAFAATQRARGKPLPDWFPRDLGEVAELFPALLIPAPLRHGRKRRAGKRGANNHNAAADGDGNGKPPLPPLPAGTLPGHVPLVELVRFKERQWYLEELDDARNGDANAMVRVARMHLHGQGCAPPSVSAAADWIRRARALGAAATLDEVVATDSPDPREAVLRRAREEEARRKELGERIGRAMGSKVAGGGGGGEGGG